MKKKLEVKMECIATVWVEEENGNSEIIGITEIKKVLSYNELESEGE